MILLSTSVKSTFLLCITLSIISKTLSNRQDSSPFIPPQLKLFTKFGGKPVLNIFAATPTTVPVLN